MDQKRICYVVTIGRTIDAFFRDQLIFLAANGFDVSVICHDDCDLKHTLPNEIRFMDVPIPRGVNLFGSLSALRELKRIFKKERFDLVQYSTPNAAFLASIAAKAARIPIRNYHLMGYRFEGESGVKRKLVKLFDQIACRNSTHVECVCNATMEKGVAMGLFPKEKAIVVGAGSTGGVNTEKFDLSKKPQWRSEIRKQFGYAEDTVVYGFVGRIAVDKGIRELLGAWEAVSAHEKTALLLVGPVEDDALQAAAEALPRVKLAGKVLDPERYFAALDVLLLPSYREGFGNVLIEAETMGVACIASDIDGPRDAMRSGETGLLVKPHDAAALADAMTALLDAAQREIYAQNAIRFAKNFDSRVLCEAILQRKNSLLGG